MFICKGLPFKKYKTASDTIKIIGIKTPTKKNIMEISVDILSPFRLKKVKDQIKIKITVIR
ncbi:MAG: hypothetical protein ACD_7C00109G0001 [uncultured bacterium]|nr:MAG: hypothetical protein ACD_7C00109G0001 [uncultured bacterium]